MPAGIGASDNFDTGLQSLLQAGNVMWIQLTTVRANVWGTDLTVKDIDGEGRDKEGTTLRHHRNELGVFIQITAMFDRINAGFNGHTQTRPAESMAHHAPAQGV